MQNRTLIGEKFWGLEKLLKCQKEYSIQTNIASDVHNKRHFLVTRFIGKKQLTQYGYISSIPCTAHAHVNHVYRVNSVYFWIELISDWNLIQSGEYQNNFIIRPGILYRSLWKNLPMRLSCETFISLLFGTSLIKDDFVFSIHLRFPLPYWRLLRYDLHRYIQFWPNCTTYTFRHGPPRTGTKALP